MRDSLVLRVMLDFYAGKLAALYKERGTSVSAGRFADYVGVSRSTAKKRLTQLIARDRAQCVRLLHTNKTWATYYAPVCMHANTKTMGSVNGEKIWECKDCGFINE